MHKPQVTFFFVSTKKKVTKKEKQLEIRLNCVRPLNIKFELHNLSEITLDFLKNL